MATNIAHTTLSIIGPTAPLELQLVAQLDYYYTHSAIHARLHFAGAGVDGVTFVVTQAGGGCEAVGLVVNLDWGLCGNNAKFIGETALFEMQNARNTPLYNGISRSTRMYQHSLLQHGYDIAVQEAQSSLTLAAIMRELPALDFRGGVMTGYAPYLTFGHTHLAEVNRLGAGFAQHFADSIHDGRPLPAVVPAQDRLLSKHLYTYDFIGTLRNIQAFRAHMKWIETKLQNNPREVALIMTDLLAVGPIAGLSKIQFFVSLIFAVKSIDDDPTKTVVWRQSPLTSGTWVECAQDFVTHLVGVDNTTQVGAIRAVLESRITW
jgi:hypothetical protein